MGLIELTISVIFGLLGGCLGVWFYWKKKIKKINEGYEEDPELYPPEGNPDLSNKDWKVEDSEEYNNKVEDRELSDILMEKFKKINTPVKRKPKAKEEVHIATLVEEDGS